VVVFYYYLKTLEEFHLFGSLLANYIFISANPIANRAKTAFLDQIYRNTRKYQAQILAAGKSLGNGTS
jgi:hypothetical protein